MQSPWIFWTIVGRAIPTPGASLATPTSAAAAAAAAALLLLLLLLLLLTPPLPLLLLLQPPLLLPPHCFASSTPTPALASPKPMSRSEAIPGNAVGGALCRVDAAWDFEDFRLHGLQADEPRIAYG
jgi:hypothetical protein